MEGLPIYILLDTSGSMYGEPIMSLQNGLQVIIAAFKRNLSTFHRVNFSLISFGDKADLLVPLTDIDEFVMPQLNCYGCTALGDAFNLAATEIAQNALDNEKERIQTWKPIVFVMTDGEPTDDYTQGLLLLRKQNISSVVVCLANQEAKISDPWLADISENIVTLDTADSTVLMSYAMKVEK